MGLLSLQSVKSGLDLVLQAADPAGDEFPNDGQVMLLVNNGSGGSITVTFVAQRPAADHPDDPLVDRVRTVAAGKMQAMPPASPRIWNQANGRVKVTYSNATNVTVAAVHVPKEV